MKRLGREEWLKLVAEYEAGELSQKEFAAKHEVSLSTLQFHLYKTRKRTLIPNSDSTPTFVPVEVVASAASSTRATANAVEALLRNGVLLRFGVGADTRYLAELFGALG